MAGCPKPKSAAGWRRVAKQAAELQVVVPDSQLLLMRSTNGQNLRPTSPPPGKRARLGAVLLLLYPHANDLCLPLTIRSERLASHRGEVSLPGGASDPEDAGPIATALRECEEEIGVAASSLELWGQTQPIYILPSNFQVTPVVAYSPSEPQLTINATEVSAVITVSLRELLDPALVMIERRSIGGIVADIPFFAIAGQKVWGATALVLSEFVARLRLVLAEAG